MLKFAVRMGALLGVCLAMAGTVLFAQRKEPVPGRAGLRTKGFLRAHDVLSYADPFIGTSKSDVRTIWGNEGGTYPGAVAPWGYIQLTPETMSAGGYDYADSSIHCFSCVHHKSGYPLGSAGEIKIMPVGPGGVRYPRTFRHGDEKAGPGYYRVMFRDDNTQVEVTVSERAGIFRFSFPAGVVPKIFVAGPGKTGSPGAGFRMDEPGCRMEETLFRLEDTGVSAVFRLSEKPVAREVRAGGVVFHFDSSSTGSRVILLKMGVSVVSSEGAGKNMDVELGKKGFDQLRAETEDKWRKGLSVIGIDDDLGNEESENEESGNDARRNGVREEVDLEKKKTIFYTALYHAMLLPWIISDADGNYRGRDGQIHRTSGENEYGEFSPWDTYRTLHPLLCLLFPKRQHDMILSMLDVYKQTGHLPTDPMTGNHAIPVIVDSWLKGIRGIDSSLAFAAMRKDLMEAPFEQADREIYRKLGYIPSAFPESVTRTVEYAYDDWAFSQFTRFAFRHKGNKEMDNELGQGSYSYRRLFDPVSLFLLPRNGDQFNRKAGNSGYKEGDKWVYSYAVPQHLQDLINLMGGAEAFSGRLDSAFRVSRVVFDNETVFHMPYLFNYSGSPDKTQQWVKAVRDGRFAATPGGLPGNDDLGSMSSWYVFSAMGIYPVCPGRPVYDIGTPLFRCVTLNLANGKRWVIKTRYEGRRSQAQYVHSLRINNQVYGQLTIPHAWIEKGGVMEFVMGDKAGVGMREKRKNGRKEGAMSNEPHFVYTRYYPAKSKVAPDELSWVHFTIENKGAMGVKIVKLLVDGREYGSKNCLVPAGSAIDDSIPFRLYAFGISGLRLEEMPALKMIVAGDDDGGEAVITDLVIRPMIPAGEPQSISFDAQNIGGSLRVFPLALHRNDSPVWEGNLTLQPGEKRMVALTLPAGDTGLQKVQIKDKTAAFKVYNNRLGSLVLGLYMDKVYGDTLVEDVSGLGNMGKIIGTAGKNIGRAAGIAGATEGSDVKGSAGGLQRTYLFDKDHYLFDKNHYLEVENAPSLDNMGETITMMTWVCQTEPGGGLVDLFTKGDNHVLQIIDNKKLGFFAGGWGRGDCGVDLPDNWLGHWHHIAGVCEGSRLRIYIDGELKGEAAVQGRVNLSVSNKWTFGRNEEFPGQRIFTGYLDKMRVYMEPLTETEIKSIMNRDEAGLSVLRK